MNTSNAIILIATAILFCGVIDDLVSKKFHNWLFLVLFFLAIISNFYFQGSYGLKLGFTGLICAMFIFIPTVWLGALGAGDLKLMMAFGVLTQFETVLEVFVYSLFWGALFGLLRALFSGKFKTIFKKNMQNQGKTFPYTIALFLGWLNVLTLNGVI